MADIPNIRFKGFTEPWEQRKLGDILVEMYNGQTPSRFKDEFWNGTISWLTSGELNRGTVYNSIEKITQAGQESANLKVVPKGTFVIAITGLEAAGTRGNCALLGFETTLNQSCMALFPNEKIVTSEFLSQWYSKVGEEYGIRYTQGTKQQSYNAELIKILPIMLPTIDEQKKIYRALFALDNLITLHQRKCDETKTLKKYMLQKMFPKKGENVPEIRFRGFTEPWEQRKLSDVILDIADGPFGSNLKTEHYTEEKEARIIQLSNLSDYGWQEENTRYTTFEHAKKIKRCIVNEGELVIGKMMPAGMTIMRPNTEKMYVLSSDCVRVKLNKKISTEEFFLYTTKSDTFLNQVNNDSQGSTRVRTSISKIREMHYAIPTMEEQIKIGSYFKQLDNLITLHQRKCDELKEVKRFMLSNMFPRKG